MTDPGSRLRAWWTDDPRDPGRLTLADKDVQCLIAKIDPGGQAIDLGGVMSLNVHLMQAGLVLRVHQPFVSRERLLALQVLRRELSVRGILVAEPVTWRGVSVVHLRDRWAELEQYVPARRRLAVPPDIGFYFVRSGSSMRLCGRCRCACRGQWLPLMRLPGRCGAGKGSRRRQYATMRRPQRWPTGYTRPLGAELHPVSGRRRVRAGYQPGRRSTVPGLGPYRPLRTGRGVALRDSPSRPVRSSGLIQQCRDWAHAKPAKAGGPRQAVVYGGVILRGWQIVQ